MGLGPRYSTGEWTTADVLLTGWCACRVVRQPFARNLEPGNRRKEEELPIDPNWDIENVRASSRTVRIIASYLDGDADKVGWAMWDLRYGRIAADPSNIHAQPRRHLPSRHDIDVTAQGDLMAIGFDGSVIDLWNGGLPKVNF